MRFFINDGQGEEGFFDILNTQRVDDTLVKADIISDKGERTSYYFKQVANKNYISKDQVNWSFAPSVLSLDKVFNGISLIDVYQGFKPSGAGEGSAGSMVTDMPGKVVKVLVSEGDEVEKGQNLLIIEAMKMENEIKAGVSGKVKSIHVEAGQSLDAGHLMLEIDH